MDSITRVLSVAMAIGGFMAFSATAGTITSQNFDVNPAITNNQTSAPGVWYIDRYAPAGFSSQSFLGDNRLALELSAADNAAGRGAQSSSFYKTQGRKLL